MHPQQAVHKLSLLASTDKDTVNGSSNKTASSQPHISPVGSNTAQSFWLNAARNIDWAQQPSIAYGHVKGELVCTCTSCSARTPVDFRPRSQRPTWYPDGTLNTCYNALDRHVLNGFGDRVCFEHYSPLPAASASPRQTMTYLEVLDEVKALAGVLRHKLGVKKGDRVIVYVSDTSDTLPARC